MKSRSIAVFLVSCLVLALCACSFPAVAAPNGYASFGSEVSGVFQAPDRFCRIVLTKEQRDPVHPHTGVDLICVGFNGSITATFYLVYTSLCGPLPAMAFVPSAPVEYVSFRGWDASIETLQVVIGTDQLHVVNGIGRTEFWRRVAIIPSPSPIVCAAAQRKPNDR